jgi:hypothetical protein
LRRAVELLSKELPPSRAAAIAAQLTGATRNEAYALATRSGGKPDAGANADDAVASAPTASPPDAPIADPPDVPRTTPDAGKN